MEPNNSAPGSQHSNPANRPDWMWPNPSAFSSGPTLLFELTNGRGKMPKAASANPSSKRQKILIGIMLAVTAARLFMMYDDQTASKRSASLVITVDGKVPIELVKPKPKSHP